MTRTFAIGDIHGCLTALDTLLETIQLREGDTLITLGDYVDRGPEARGVIERLRTLGKQHTVIPLRGNHEMMMCTARDSERSLADWMLYGGEATLASYGGSLEQVPEEHWQFIEQECRRFYETDTHIFVHASLLPDSPLAEQPDWMLYWERFRDFGPHMSGKTVICGHTSQKNGMPKSLGHSVCIDTWACGGQWLSCLDTRSGQIVQANQEGQTRQLWLDEL